MDVKIFDLIEDDEEAEKDEKEALAHNLKVCVGIKKKEMFLKRQERDEFRSQVCEFPFGSPRRVGIEMGVKLAKLKNKAI